MKISLPNSPTPGGLSPTSRGFPTGWESGNQHLNHTAVANGTIPERCEGKIGVMWSGCVQEIRHACYVYICTTAYLVGTLGGVYPGW